MTVCTDLPSPLREAVEEELNKGVYSSRAEMLREGLKLLLRTRIDPDILSDETVEKINRRTDDISKEDLIHPEELRKELDI